MHKSVLGKINKLQRKHWESEYFFRKKHLPSPPPLQVKWVVLLMTFNLNTRIDQPMEHDIHLGINWDRIDKPNIRN